MPTPLSSTRRIELLEQQLAELRGQLAGVQGRGDRSLSQREFFLAVTVPPEAESYPTSGDTFWLRFVDAEYTATAGTQTVTKHYRAADGQAVGRTIFGQWVLPGELVAVFPAPQPPNLSGKGTWWILAPFTYVGKADGPIAKNATDGAGYIWAPTFSGTTGYRLTGMHNYTAEIPDLGKFSVTFDRGTPIVAPLECQDA